LEEKSLGSHMSRTSKLLDNSRTAVKTGALIIHKINPRVKECMEMSHKSYKTAAAGTQNFPT
jgi:hypothetical protein